MAAFVTKKLRKSRKNSHLCATFWRRDVSNACRRWENERRMADFL